MFTPDPFPLHGEIFERVLRTLRGSGRDNYNALYHFHLLSKPQCWEDRLQPAQKRLCFLIFKPESWYESGAAGEFIAALQAVPVLGLYLVRRLNVLKFVAISSYSGRVAVFFYQGAGEDLLLAGEGRVVAAGSAHVARRP